jgi:hypothetical protein
MNKINLFLLSDPRGVFEISKPRWSFGNSSSRYQHRALRMKVWREDLRRPRSLRDRWQLIRIVMDFVIVDLLYWRCLIIHKNYGNLLSSRSEDRCSGSSNWWCRRCLHQWPFVGQRLAILVLEERRGSRHSCMRVRISFLDRMVWC